MNCQRNVPCKQQRERTPNSFFRVVGLTPLIQVYVLNFRAFEFQAVDVKVASVV